MFSNSFRIYFQGTVRLETYHRQLKVSLDLSGFESESESKNHGFHVHQKGDIVTDGCQSTGGLTDGLGGDFMRW